MAFAEADWNALLPSFLTSSDKERLKQALAQFKKDDHKNISYLDFYSMYDYNYFLQADILSEIRYPKWDHTNRVYKASFPDSIIISNSCDISFENNRNINPKQCLFAPLVELAEFESDLIAAGYEASKLNQLFSEIRRQSISNLLYLPHRPDNKKEYIAFLDRLFWLPIDDLNSLVGSIKDDRVASLNQFGYYLFVLKLSYHICRLPEEIDRPYQPSGNFSYKSPT